MRKSWFIYLLAFCPLLALGQDPGDFLKAPSGRTVALVVGISGYQNISRLNYADDDAYLFAQYLVEQKICDKPDVKRLIDSEATQPAFYKELYRFRNELKKGDRLFLYFSGHGDVENAINSGFLLTYNTEPNVYSAFGIDISQLENHLDAFVNKEVKVVLITDACRAGYLAGGLTGSARTIASLTNGFKNMLKILSCQPNQLSREQYFSEGGHGIFTYHLIDALSGLSDRNNDGQISLRELDLYLDTVGMETDHEQDPKVDGGDPQQILVAYNPDLKKALLTKKSGNTGPPIAKTKNSIDSNWNDNKYFRQFNANLKAHQYISPENNAYATLQAAEKNKQDPRMLSDMKFELMAVLEDEVQKWISIYLRGELKNDENKIINALNLAVRYLETIEKIIDKKDFRTDELKAKKYFFQAFIIYKLSQKESYERAIELLTEALEIQKGQAWLYNLAGMFYAETKKYKLAEANFRDAVQFSPTWAYPWYNLGHLYQDMNLDSTAIVLYKKSISLDSSFSLPLNNLGLLYQKQEKYIEAEALFKKTIQSDSSNAGIWLNYGHLLFYNLNNLL